MSRYYFDIISGTETVPDMDGASFASLAEAIVEGRKSARELLVMAILDERQHPKRISICDHQRREVASVSLKSMIPKEMP